MDMNTRITINSELGMAQRPSEELVDLFISDALLPVVGGRAKKIRTSELYEGFTEWCKATNIPLPCTLNLFSRHMSRRFRKNRSNGNSWFHCEWKPGIFVGEEEITRLTEEGNTDDRTSD